MDDQSFGTPTEAESELAELIVSMIPSIERLRFVSSGTEATLSAVRLARGYTGRAKIVKFAGCYHGHADSFLIAAGSGALTAGVPNSPGVTEGTAADTLVLPFNDAQAVEGAFAVSDTRRYRLGQEIGFGLDLLRKARTVQRRALGDAEGAVTLQ